MKKLVLFGDSLIALFHKDEVSELEKQTGYEVYSCATSGWNSEDGVNKASYISQLNPDVTVFSFGTNDSAPWNSVKIQNFVENIRTIIKIFSSSKIIFLLPPPTKDERRSNELIEQYSEAAKQVLNENSVTYIDSWKVFKEMLDSNQNYHDSDNLHFNELGYNTVINEIAKILNEV